MPDLVTLSCPTCGARLQITADLDRFACSHCGQEHVVRRDGGIISLAPVVQELRGMRLGVDKTAAELALARLEKEVEIRKGKLAGARNSTYDSIFPPRWSEYLALGALAILLWWIMSNLAIGQFVMAGIWIVLFVAVAIFWHRTRISRITAARLEHQRRIDTAQLALQEAEQRLAGNRRVLDS